MGSVMNDITCPFCKGAAVEDYYYETFEVYKYCAHCGWSENTVITNWNDREKPDWKAQYETHGTTFPLGTMVLEEEGDGCVRVATISADTDEERFRNYVLKNIKGIQVAFISKLIDGKIVRENLLSGEVVALDPKDVQEGFFLPDDSPNAFI